MSLKYLFTLCFSIILTSPDIAQQHQYIRPSSNAKKLILYAEKIDFYEDKTPDSAIYYAGIGLKFARRSVVSIRNSGIINRPLNIIWLMDSEFNTITANQAFNRRIQQSMERLRDKPSEAEFLRVVFKRWKLPLSKPLAGSSCKFIRKNYVGDRMIYEEVSLHPVFAGTAEVIAISCFLLDITAAKKYENEIRRQHKKLGEIAMLQSHLVRAPVANILGLVELFKNKLINELGIDNMISEAANNMDKAIREITDVVQSALD